MTQSDTNHFFLNKDENGNWLIKCKQTEGLFSSMLWVLGKTPSKQCPCCGILIKTHQANKPYAKEYLNG